MDILIICAASILVLTGLTICYVMVCMTKLVRDMLKENEPIEADEETE